MGTHFSDFTFVHDNNLVGIFDGTKAVCYNNARSAFKKLAQIFHNHPFIIGIEGIGRLVEKQESGVPVSGTGNEQALSLPLANAIALRPDHGVVAQGQSFHEILHISERYRAT